MTVKDTQSLKFHEPLQSTSMSVLTPTPTPKDFRTAPDLVGEGLTVLTSLLTVQP